MNQTFKNFYPQEIMNNSVPVYIELTVRWFTTIFFSSKNKFDDLIFFLDFKSLFF